MDNIVMTPFIFALWIFFCFVVWRVASNKGRWGFGYFLLSLILSPIIGLIFAGLAGRNEAELDRRKLAGGRFKRCPYCAELIKKRAVVCRFCGRETDQNKLETAPTPPGNE